MKLMNYLMVAGAVGLMFGAFVPQKATADDYYRTYSYTRTITTPDMPAIVNEKPVYIDKVIEKPVYIDRVVEKPVYIDRVIEKPVAVERVIEKPVIIQERIIEKPMIIKQKSTHYVLPLGIR